MLPDSDSRGRCGLGVSPSSNSAVSPGCMITVSGAVIVLDATPNDITENMGSAGSWISTPVAGRSPVFWTLAYVECKHRFIGL